MANKSTGKGYYTAKEKQEATAQRLAYMAETLKGMTPGTPAYEKLKEERKVLLQSYYDSFNKLKVTLQ